YIGANWAISQRAELLARTDLTARAVTSTMVVAQPVPVAFWRRTILWRDDRRYGDGDYRLGSGVAISARSQPLGLADPRLASLLARRKPARAFVSFARMPIVTDLDGKP